MTDAISKIFAPESIQLGTLLSLCSGIALAVIGFVRTRLEDRKRYTLGVLMGYSQSTELLKMLHHIRQHAARIKAGAEHRVDDAMAEQLAVVLPHFQSIALAAKSGLLNRDIIVSARYGTMKTIWDAYGPYVKSQRIELGRPLLYVELEEFLRDNAARYSRYQARFTGS
jgi:hypothetical protein